MQGIEICSQIADNYLASRIASIHMMQSASLADFNSYWRWLSLLYDMAKHICKVTQNVKSFSAYPNLAGRMK